MAAGLVSHNITTASGVTFAVISWVPNTGAPDVGAVPVARITDGTSVAPVDATNGLAVQIVPALPAGSNAIGKLAANSGVNIGTVTVDATQLQALGQGAMANSVSVAVASDQTAVPIKAASAAIASGAIASGAVASGAFASGALASGALASGSVASGAFASGALASGSVAAGAIVQLPAAFGSGGGLKVDDIFGQYETVAASQTAQAMGATGATGDYLAYVIVFPGTAGCGVVTILDNAGTWGTFAGGGTTALPSLVPFRIDVGAYSTSGAWKITTGANVTAVGVGRFT